MSPIWLIVGLLGVLALALLVSAVIAFRSRRAFSGLLASLAGVAFAAIGVAAATAAWAFASFETLTRETVAAVITVEPIAETEDAFAARIRLASGEERTVRLTGEQVFVDAYIVKWHPWAVAVGLPTGYRLDRIGGRYRSIDDERTRPRTVESLTSELDPMAARVFHAVEGWSWLEPLVDARYGSGTFVDLDPDATIEVRVSPTGLLMRTTP